MKFKQQQGIFIWAEPSTGRFVLRLRRDNRELSAPYKKIHLLEHKKSALPFGETYFFYQLWILCNKEYALSVCIDLKSMLFILFF